MPKTPKVIEFKATTLTAMTAIVRDLDPARVSHALQTLLGDADNYFVGELAVIDLGQLAIVPQQIDCSGLSALLGSYGLQAVAVKNVPEHLMEVLRGAGFATLAKPAGRTVSSPTPAEEDVAPPAIAPAVPTLIIDRPVRSGQQIYAPGGDLILLNGVSPGAEVIADGNIHCYGPLRGRAVAGAQGNTSTRIFCTNFGPELISIAGTYRTFDFGIEPNLAAKPAQARLGFVATDTGGKYTLNIEPLQLD